MAKKFTVNLEQEQYNELLYISAQQGLSVGETLRRILTQGIDAYHGVDLT